MTVLGMLAILYKEKRLWKVAVENRGDLWVLIKEYGIEGGKIQHKENTVKGKNIGRSNETSPKQQAEKEAAALWKKQKEKGYAERDQVAEKVTAVFLPMLAHPYKLFKKRLKSNVYVQPKIDGIRMLAQLNERDEIILKTRTGKIIEGFPKIRKALEEVIPSQAIIMDGEMFAPGISFEQLCSDFKMGKETLTYHVFDFYDDELQETTFHERLPVLKAMMCGLDDVTQIIETHLVMNTRIEEFHDQFVEQGWEGIMIREQDSKYTVGRRSRSLLKWKYMATDEFKVRNHCTDKDGFINWICQTWSNKVFRVVPNGTRKKLSAKEASEFHGEMLTVQYQNLTDKGVPRFPVGLGFRNYE